MEEIQSQSDNYRSSSSSASSPASRVPSSNFFYMRKPGAVRQPISFEDSPEWEDTDLDVRMEEGGDHDSINMAMTPASPSLSKLNSCSLPSPPIPESVAAVRKIAGACVVWRDLTVTIKGKRKYSDKVIKSSRGYALPGTMTVIMGPARSGKSTLLRAIAGRLHHSAKMYGEVFVNGSKSPLPYGSYGFVERETTLIGSLTVREYLYYAALLQLPGFFCQKKSVVEDAIHAMSLTDYANKLIGGHCYMKGLSRGERRRLSIARELVMRPHVLFIDEPLYHLDSSVSALLMMVTLKKLASTGCTLIFTLYQSSTEVFGLFDRICLLSNGNTLFFGETLACLQHFSNAGFPCPIMQSPSDHFLRAINTEFDRIIAMCKNWQDDGGDFSSVNMDTAVAIRTLEATFKQSADSAAVETMIFKLTEREGPLLKTKGRAGFGTRIAVLTWRSLLIMSREWKYYWLRLILYMALALCIGTVFSGLGHSLSSVVTRVAAVFVFVSFTSLLSIAGVPALVKEVEIYASEESNMHSGALVFLLGQFLSSIPFLFLISISSSLVFYFLIGLTDEFSLLMYFVLNFFMCLLVNEGLMLLVVSLWRHLFWSVLTLVSIHVVMMLSAGYFRVRNALPGPFWTYPISYVAFHTYCIQGILENEYLVTTFAVGQVRSISGYQALRSAYDISLDSSAKWENLLVLLFMAIAYRVVVFFVLHFGVGKNGSVLRFCRFKPDKNSNSSSNSR
ncbi:ABC transporter G family member 3 [Linum perenne]